MRRSDFTIGGIKRRLRTEAPLIARQYSALWEDLVHDVLRRIERDCKDRMNDGVYDEMLDYGLTWVRKHGLPADSREVAA